MGSLLAYGQVGLEDLPGTEIPTTLVALELMELPLTEVVGLERLEQLETATMGQGPPLEQRSLYTAAQVEMVQLPATELEPLQPTPTVEEVEEELETQLVELVERDMFVLSGRMLSLLRLQLAWHQLYLPQACLRQVCRPLL